MTRTIFLIAGALSVPSPLLVDSAVKGILTQNQTPVIQALGEKGKRLLDVVQPQEPQQPQDVKSRPLFENWKSSARRDGKIPGGRIGEMAASLKTFIDLNPGHEQSVKLESLLKKCDASRDWTPAEAATLLDEIAAITPRAEWAMRTTSEREIHPGKPLPYKLAAAPWGKPAANGLRSAWLLEPRAKTQALDSVMTSRVLFHNTGKAPVCFATWAHILGGGHKAQDASAKDIIA